MIIQSAAEFTSANPILKANQVGLEVDTNASKQGNGVTPWTSLPYTEPAWEYAATSGTNSYTINIQSDKIIGYYTGQPFRLKFGATNTGVSTLNVNSLGAKAIRKNGTDPLVAGDIISGQIYQVTYDGTNFQILSPVTNSSGGGWEWKPYVGVGPTGIIEEWYAPVSVDISASTGFIANRIFAESLFIKETITFDQIRCECTTALAASSAQLGIYSDNGFKFPGALLVDAGTVSCATTGIKAITFGSPITVTAGTRIWTGINCTSSSIGFRYSIRRVSYLGRPAGVTTAMPWGWATVYAFDSTMPDPYPTATIGYISQTTQSPLVELRRSA